MPSANTCSYRGAFHRYLTLPLCTKTFFVPAKQVGFHGKTLYLCLYVYVYMYMYVRLSLRQSVGVTVNMPVFLCAYLFFISACFEGTHSTRSTDSQRYRNVRNPKSFKRIGVSQLGNVKISLSLCAFRP